MTSVVTMSWAADSVRVVDGDTINVHGVRYRLHGIDAPEAGQSCIRADGKSWACGQEAIRAIEGIVEGRNVECQPKGADPYGRIIAICLADGLDINSKLVSSGNAWAFRKYSEDYAATEDKARESGIGVWQGENEPAWVYRARKWDASLEEVPDRRCPIKGNINRKNEKIYHTPWSRDWSKTKINLKSGERWFCSEDEAIAAGWRAPLWGH